MSFFIFFLKYVFIVLLNDCVKFETDPSNEFKLLTCSFEPLELSFIVIYQKTKLNFAL